MNCMGMATLVSWQFEEGLKLLKPLNVLNIEHVCMCQTRELDIHGWWIYAKLILTSS